MKQYYFQLLNESYNDLGAFIPDGSSKQAAINRAKKWMRENRVNNAQLSVNSIATSNLLDIIEININLNRK